MSITPEKIEVIKAKMKAVAREIIKRDFEENKRKGVALSEPIEEAYQRSDEVTANDLKKHPDLE